MVHTFTFENGQSDVGPLKDRNDNIQQKQLSVVVNGHHSHQSYYPH